MRTYEISSPAAAELYFNQSFVGGVTTLVGALIDKIATGLSKRPSHRRGGATRDDARRQGVLDRLDRWFWQQQQKAQEAYLANAQDIFDLERRIEAIDRGAVRPYY